MDNQTIWETVSKIRKQCHNKSQNEQIEENSDFFNLYPALLFMARDPTMNLDTFKVMLDLKNQIDTGKAEKEQVDKCVGQIFYDQYVGNKE
jgi:hypothetical protein